MCFLFKGQILVSLSSSPSSSSSLLYKSSLRSCVPARCTCSSSASVSDDSRNTFAARGNFKVLLKQKLLRSQFCPHVFPRSTSVDVNQDQNIPHRNDTVIRVRAQHTLTPLAQHQQFCVQGNSLGLGLRGGGQKITLRYTKLPFYCFPKSSVIVVSSFTPGFNSHQFHQRGLNHTIRFSVLNKVDLHPAVSDRIFTRRVQLLSSSTRSVTPEVSQPGGVDG